ncbi:hypothetical protein LIER_22027 [Lithospermum erythrorhizon]|uniref:Uncharacterized protein n=1 Tax=Lithospermum erythrorhizon TaxID=34254 RepID=A0AAV3QWJ4_LITER
MEVAGEDHGTAPIGMASDSGHVGSTANTSPEDSGRTPDTVLASIWNHFLITPFTFVKTSTKSFLITKNIPLPLTPSQAPYIYSISSLPWELKIFLILVTFSLGRVQEEIERYMKNCIEQWETSRGLTLSPPLRVVASLFKYLITALYSLLPNFFQILSSHTQA